MRLLIACAATPDEAGGVCSAASPAPPYRPDMSASVRVYDPGCLTPGRWGGMNPPPVRAPDLSGSRCDPITREARVWRHFAAVSRKGADQRAAGPYMKLD